MKKYVQYQIFVSEYNQYIEPTHAQPYICTHALHSKIVTLSSLSDEILHDVTQNRYRVVRTITVSHATRQHETSSSHVALSVIKYLSLIHI